ncbi:YpdA family putative bacillithiol disulfide reductase [Paenibacillus lemnae]|uniref:YpdA family putative bacillithiol disulfide reductase n=1 Tax=Paenibacillus lemnae TaxID=1330551 RepID=A0A848M5N8_PAELE|nr:YpdA family putative bacillithiol disulfide reductase [Paenibacillus lemnae]NMO96267.1 YpdA family putative bacillithiol disulfide reductase [Paenibacillus lemnae]
MQDVLIIGAGPCGLSAAIECEKRGFSTEIIDKHNVVHSIYLYPTHMQFFSTAEMLEIGGVPFALSNDKPYRDEALAYYRRVAKHYQLKISPYEEALSIKKQPDGTFQVHTRKRSGTESVKEAKHVVISTGYFDHPNYIGIPGEDLDKVTHYFREAHPYAGMKTAIIGGSNSAVDAAMELIRVGADVSVIYRGSEISQNIKPWVRPLFDSLVTKQRISLYLESSVTDIRENSITIKNISGEEIIVDNDFVLALTGFRPDRKLLASSGVELDDGMEKPSYNPETMETTVPGLFVAGVIASGRNANEVFIETGRDHGRLIAEYLSSAKTV